MKFYTIDELIACSPGVKILKIANRRVKTLDGTEHALLGMVARYTREQLAPRKSLRLNVSEDTYNVIRAATNRLKVAIKAHENRLYSGGSLIVLDGKFAVTGSSEVAANA